ncbi:flagellar filament capping protein FliD [Porticoccaceae bacterium]|nr:flagellar filament capping protein FliD [Porticoccaceae bacterium]MDC0004267.1 flagellar filament capping protein FliD [Porticoccaceae bacterium]
MADAGSVSSQVLTTLGVGSGLDVFKLAQDLTDVEKVPKKESIESDITATEASISGYGLVSFQVGQLQKAFETLNDADELATSTGSSSNTSAISLTSLDGAAATGAYDITVTRLAQEQRMISDEYTATTTTLNSSAFDISIAVGSSTTTTTAVTVSTPTPAGVVSAINAASTGVTASLVDTGIGGTNYRIILTGPTGSEGAFTMSSTPDLGFGDSGNTLQAAQDSIINFDGLTVTRSSNEISDVIAGATISLTETTSTAVRLNIVSDRTTLKTNLENVVTAYNDLNTLFTELTAEGSEAELGGALADDTSLVRYLKSQIRSALFADSSTTSGSVSALRDLGVSIDKTGNLTLNETTYDAVVASSYDDVVMMLSANTSDQNLFGTESKGLSQDIATILEDFSDSTGVLTTRTSNAEGSLQDYKDELVKLEARMEGVYQRYLTQFSAMESLIASMDTTKDYLEGQLESLSKAYDS